MNIMKFTSFAILLLFSLVTAVTSYSKDFSQGRRITIQNAFEVELITVLRNHQRNSLSLVSENVTRETSEDTLLSWNQFGMAMVWDINMSKVILSLDHGETDVLYSIFNPQETYIVTITGSEAFCCNRKVHIWDISKKEEVLVLDTVPLARDIAFSPDGAYLAIGSERLINSIDESNLPSVHIIDMTTFKVELVIGNSGGLTFHPISGQLTIYHNSTLQTWDILSKTEIQTIDANTATLSQFSPYIHYSPKGQFLALVPYEGKSVEMWNSTFDQHMILTAQDNIINTVAFSPDENLIAIGLINGNVKVFRTNSGLELAELHQHQYLITDMAFNSESDLLAIASGDGDITLWDVFNYELLNTLTQQNSLSPPIYSLLFTQNETILASAGAAGVIYLWGIPQ